MLDVGFKLLLCRKLMVKSGSEEPSTLVLRDSRPIEMPSLRVIPPTTHMSALFRLAFGDGSYWSPVGQMLNKAMRRTLTSMCWFR